ncbi:regulator of G protein, partial [Scheffersomyces stipitis CBS 6054]
NMADEKYQSNYPNSHYLSNLNNPHGTNQTVQLDRLPTLGEILANKTKSPVDISTFYQFMRDVENKSDYLDFWFEMINHLSLCRHYVKGLRDSIMRQSTYTEKRASQPLRTPLRDSLPASESKHKSLSSSILLDLIASDNFLEDNDSHRLSQFLRGDINMDNLDPKLRDLIQHYNDETNPDETNVSRTTPNLSKKYSADMITQSPNPPFAEKRLSSTSHLLRDLDDDGNGSFVANQLELGQADRAVSPNKYVSLQHPKRNSVVSPSLLERLIKESPGSTNPNSFITRDRLRESSHNLLLKYFVEDSEKNLNLPSSLNSQIIKAIEVEGRDDPDVFINVKNYVFNRIENEHLPRFLNFVAIRNINHSNFIRIILGFFFLFGGFWISYIFVFLNYRKSIRPIIVAPYLLAFYFLISSIYLIDPVLAWFGYSESFSRASGSPLIKIRENFIYKLVFKRSLWVLFLILLCTAILTVVFSLVPGVRL